MDVETKEKKNIYTHTDTAITIIHTYGDRKRDKISQTEKKKKRIRYRK